MTSDTSNNAMAPSIENDSASTTDNRFDPKRLRLSQRFDAEMPAKKRITSVAVSKPDRQQWVRVHPSEDYRMNIAIIEDKANKRYYAVDNALVEELAAEVKYVTLFTTISRDGKLFLWPVALPNNNSRACTWHESARAAAAIAVDTWVRVVSNMSEGVYECWEAVGKIAAPEWPELPFGAILGLAFGGDRYINSLEHPFVQSLKGVR